MGPLDDPSSCSIAWNPLPLRLVDSSSRYVTCVAPLFNELVYLGEIESFVKTDVLRVLLRGFGPLDGHALQGGFGEPDVVLVRS